MFKNFTIRDVEIVQPIIISASLLFFVPIKLTILFTVKGCVEKDSFSCLIISDSYLCLIKSFSDGA